MTDLTKEWLVSQNQSQNIRRNINNQKSVFSLSKINFST